MAQPKQSLQTLRIIWSALVLSNFILGGVAWFLHQNQQTASGVGAIKNPQEIQNFVIVFAVISMVQMLLSTQILPNILLQNAKNVQTETPIEQRAASLYHTTTIIRCALAESSSLFGIVLVTLGSSLQIALGFVLWGLLGIFAAMPNENRLDEITRDLRHARK